MPMKIVRNDITKMKVDAIVTPSNNDLKVCGGVNGHIHRAAGDRLLADCEALGGCETGCAKITRGYKLPCKYVIHTVGPRWQDGGHGEKEKLISCYRASLALAKDKKCQSVAFPLISSGNFGYPKDKALRVAADTIGEFLMENDMTVYIVIFDKKSYRISEKLFSDIEEYIDNYYADEILNKEPERYYRSGSFNSYQQDYDDDILPYLKPQNPKGFAAASLENALKQLDESFSDMLLRKIDESGMTDAQVYRKANIDRKLFSKIRSNKHYKPSKPTVIAFAIALELSLEETKDMLMKAGFALSHSSKFDIIIEYYIERGKYNIIEINEALFAFDQSLLGS